MNRKFLSIVSRFVLFFFVSANLHAATTDLATSPLVTSPTSSVKPNLMFILDDSGSMDSAYMPDWSNSSNDALFRNNDYNGVAYDPAVTYSPPGFYDAAGALDTTTYKSQTAANTRGSCSADYCAVKRDGYGVQSTSTDNLVGSARYYTFIAGEYCDAANLRNCVTQSAASAAYPFPATLRWCTTSALTSCQAVRIETGTTTYQNARYPTTATATISFSSPGSAVINSVKVNGVEIISAATLASSTDTTVATRVAANINACTTAKTGFCDVAGYSASRSGSTLTITAANGTGAITFTPTVNVSSGSATVTRTAFGGGLPGTNLRVDIVSTNDSYPYPGTTAKASTRSDCAGTTCTYSEEMTNYANWWAYYHTRMQMMKTSSSLAFQSVGTTHRVAYMSINNNTTTDFLNFATFDATQKRAWLQKFFAAIPNNNTPLREALSNAGRIYAGKKNGTTFRGSTVVDPMQYSCQQNFTILSTDGYWNDNAGFKLDGSSSIGNTDGAEARPINDGSTIIVTASTPQVNTDRKQSVQNITTTTPYTRTNTTIGASCTVGSNPTSCPKDDGDNSSGDRRRWCTVGTNNPSGSSDCQSIASGVFVCRGTGDEDNLPSGGTACRTSGSDTWCVYTNNTTGTSCVGPLAQDSHGNPNNTWICKAPSGAGNQVTVQNQSYTRTQTGTITSVDDYPTNRTQNIVTTNGVAAPATYTTPAAGTTTNVTAPVTSYSTDTGAPGGSTTWTNGTSSGPTCTATASLPAAGFSTPAAGTVATVNNGSAALTTQSTTGYVSGTTSNTTSTTGGTSNTLADVAEYYYVNDLRTSALGNCTGAVVSPATTGFDVCTDDVPTSGLDGAAWQHMTTFTLGIAGSGNMLYSSSYATATSGDYFDVKNGTVANPSGGVCSWQASGSGACNWPVPVSDTQTAVDDLWHAAVNGRGTYFQATSPSSLAAGLSSALANVSARTGSSAAATTSNPNVTSGDNFVFSSTFTTQEWDGELVRQQLSLSTGVVSSTIDWTSQSQLDTNSSRVIYTFDSGATSKLKSFAWANLTGTEQAYFNTPNISGLTQFCSAGVTCLAAADKTLAAGSNLVSFLRGDRSHEGSSTDTTTYYRQRVHLLGDIVNAEAVYVKTPLFNFSDTGYTAYVTAQASRQGMVYVAANDGMMHAINATTGAESWAYVPLSTMPNLYKLADKSYTGNHSYFIDGTPVSGDAYFSGAWHTILVGGMNAGGRGYYALDVTDPANPKALWEFTDTNLGYTYGNPVITKLKDGTWVVMVASGYNNVTPGDGVGRLYILNAATGALIRSIATTAGSTTTPSGLARINAWVDNTTSDNTALRVYGGDLLGNLWRFDVNGDVGAAGYDAQRLITFYSNSAGTVTQPITAKPELGEVSGVAVIYVGTGSYLGTSDLTDTSQQSFYAVKDALGSTALANPRATGSLFIPQVMTTSTCPAGSPVTICTTGQTVRITSTTSGSPPTAVATTNFATQNGWYVDLPDSGERANTDPTLALGTLGFTTNIPNTSACTAGGSSFRYLLDYRTGQMVSTSTTNVSGVKLGNALATRGVFVRLPNNTVVQLTRLSDGTTVTTNVPIGSGAGTTRRVSWRELIMEQ